MPLVSYAKKLFQKIDTAFSFDLLVTLFVVALLVYGKSLFNGFVGDDYAQIISNEAIKQGDAIFSIFAKGTFATGGAGGGLGGIYYKPLMTFLFALIYNGVGLTPFAFHALSLLTHISNVFLLFFVSRNFFKVAKFQYAQASAFLLSLIFLIHPGNSETVLYIADMQDLLVAFSLLLSLLFLQSLKKPLLSLKKCLILGLFLLGGMFGKESGIVALVLIPVYAFLFFKPIWKRVLAVSIAVFFVYILFRFQIAHIPLFQPLGFIPIHAATPWQRFLTMPFELFSYLRLIFFPADLFLYQHDVVFSLLDWKFYLLLPVDIVVGGFLLWFAVVMRSKLYTFLLIWMILGFGIVMNLIPLDMTLEERWLYLPFIGFLCAFFLIINGILAKWSSCVRLCIIVGLCLLIPLYVGRSFVRSLNFQNNLSTL